MIRMELEKDIQEIGDLVVLTDVTEAIVKYRNN